MINHAIRIIIIGVPLAAKAATAAPAEIPICRLRGDFDKFFDYAKRQNGD